jgi:hypothetical protein
MDFWSGLGRNRRFKPNIEKPRERDSEIPDYSYPTSTSGLLSRRGKPRERGWKGNHLDWRSLAFHFRLFMHAT